jgi:hypothetical protein
MTISLDHPALTLALAMLVGVLAQLAARHARVPGIVLLLAACPVAAVLPIVRVRRGEVDLLTRGTEVRVDDDIYVGVWRPSVAEAATWFEANGWVEVKPPPAAPAQATAASAVASPATPA